MVVVVRCYRRCRRRRFRRCSPEPRPAEAARLPREFFAWGQSPLSRFSRTLRLDWSRGKQRRFHVRAPHHSRVIWETCSLWHFAELTSTTDQTETWSRKSRSPTSRRPHQLRRRRRSRVRVDLQPWSGHHDSRALRPQRNPPHPVPSSRRHRWQRRTCTSRHRWTGI